MKQNMQMYPNYPVYPMPNPMPNMMPDYSNQGQNYNYDNGRLQEEINDLKKRVTALERTVNNDNYNGTKFSDTNYHIM